MVAVVAVNGTGVSWACVLLGIPFGLLAAFEEKRDLIALGAYTKGSDARLDQAIAAAPDLERFLRQDATTNDAATDTVQALKAIADRYPERR